MLSRLRREFIEHPVRSMAILFTLYTLIMINLKLFDPAGPWWRGWHDQKEYLASARAFAHLDLDPAKHWYPLIYSLTAAPFAWMPAPFVPINIACFVLAYAGFRRVSAHFGVGDVASAVLFVVTTQLDRRLTKLWIEPWTTTVSAALIWFALAEAADWMAGRGRRAWLLGVVLALIALVRPADVVVSAIIGGFALWRPVIGERRIQPLLAGLGSALAVVAAYGALYLAIYGPRLTDYMILSQDYGINLADLGWKASVLLVAPGLWFPGQQGLFAELPWLVVGLAGLILALVRLRGPAQALAACLLLVTLAYSAMMIAYVDLLPPGMWRFFNVHYFKWLLPLFGLFVWLLVRWRDWRGVAILVALLLVTCLRYEPVPAAPDAPAKALVFDSPEAPESDIYFARSAIVDAAGVQRSPADYHQVRDGDRVIATAFKRPFAADARWYGAPPPGMAHWVEQSGLPDVVLPGPWPKPTRERWAARLAFGWPCWAPPFGCRMR